MATLKLGEKSVEVKKLTRNDTKGQLLDLQGEDMQDKLLQLATGLSNDEIGELSLGEYFKLSSIFNEVNEIEGLDSFQKPQEN